MELYVQQFITFLLIFLRVTSLFVTAPMFGDQTIPLPVKVALGLFLSFVLFSFNAHTLSVVDQKLIGLVILGVKEIFAGASLGFAVGIIFGGVRYAGELIGFDMGFSMATMFDPETNASFPVISELLYLFLLMMFILMNGPHFILESLHASYTTIPLGEWGISQATIASIIAITGQMFVIAVKISAPVLISMFLANVSLGILNKAMPQMNIFGVMFPLKIGIGIIVMAATVPVIAFVFKKLLTAFESSIVELLRVM